MVCPYCKHEMPDDARFCPVCGIALEEGSFDPDSGENKSRQGGTKSGGFQQGKMEAGRAYAYERDDDATELVTPNDRQNRDSGFQNADKEPQERGQGQAPGESQNSQYEKRRKEAQKPDFDNEYDEDDDRTARTLIPILGIIIGAAVAVLIVVGIRFYLDNRTMKPVGSTIPMADSVVVSAQGWETEDDTEESDEEESVTASESSGDAPKEMNEIVNEDRTVTPVPTATPSPAATFFLTEGQNDANAMTKWAAPSNSDYVFPDSSSVLLTENDLAGKSAWELTIGRNEICARHGYTFNRHDLQNYFNSKSWYQPISQFKLEDVLNSTEYQNMLFIDQYQDEHGLQA